MQGLSAKICVESTGYLCSRRRGHVSGYMAYQWYRMHSQLPHIGVQTSRFERQSYQYALRSTVVLLIILANSSTF